MNALTQRSGTAVAALQGLKKGIANVKSTLVKKGGDPFLRLLKDGSWVYGQDDVEVEAGSAWAINPMSIMHGWVAWERGDDADNSGGPEQDIMVPASLPLPSQDSLPKLVKAQRYEQQFSFSMMCLTGEDKGEQVLYKTASVGGVAAVDQILNAISAQLDDDPENPVPVVVLDTDEYKHRKYGRTFTPIFSIKAWRPMSDDLPDVQAELDEQQQGAETEQPEPDPAKPARQRKATSVPKAGTTVVDEDPELKALEEAIARKAAAKQAGKAATVPVDDAAAKKAARMAELKAQLEAMEDGDVGEPAGAVEEASDATVAQPIRRRRNA